MNASRLGRLLVTCCVLSLSGCHARDVDSADSNEPDYGQPVLFTLGTIEGGELSSDTTRGRTTALLFVTTYDLPSQAEAQLLRDVLSTHKPLANAAIVMMEPPRAAPLAQVWADSIGVKLPIAMASPALLAGESQLGRIVGVPTLLVLDRRGRLIARSEGATTRAEITEALTRADQQ
ncbi:MAG TPA: hypothetical protein VHB79_14345 [Polyangiaceae bacterium]|nr:hypothetical protein [Polyangiaceae bacterium]